MIKNLWLFRFLSRSSVENTRFKVLQQSCILGPVSTHCSRQGCQRFTSSVGGAPLYNYKPDNNDSNENVPLDVNKEVQKVIGLWVQDVEGDQPTEQQDENLKAEIIRLAELVKAEKIKQARLGKDMDLDEDNSANSKTIDNRRKVRVTESTNAGQPTTLLELAKCILGSLDDDKLRELEFTVVDRDYGPILFESRNQFQAWLNYIRNDRIDVVELGRWKYCISIQQAYVDVQAMICTSNILRERINKLAGTFETLEEGVLKWNENFVKPMDENEVGHIWFCCDCSKGSAIVVSGESGSGKTWFSQKYIPNRLGKHDLTLIYCSLEENDGHERIKSDESLKSHQMACDKGMRYLRDANHSDCDVYQSLRDLSLEYAKSTDNLAYAWLKKKIDQVLSKDDIIKEWWNAKGRPKFERLEKLVLVVDEVEKNPELARGLVSTVRTLYGDVEMHKANRVLLVLAGSGLDRLFVERPLPEGIYRTGPPLANIIHLRGPDLSRNEIYGIPTNSILKGTCSRILATNTRMLTRGVLPMMMLPELTAHVSDERKQKNMLHWVQAIL